MMISLNVLEQYLSPLGMVLMPLILVLMLMVFIDIRIQTTWPGSKNIFRFYTGKYLTPSRKSKMSLVLYACLALHSLILAIQSTVEEDYFWMTWHIVSGLAAVVIFIVECKRAMVPKEFRFKKSCY